MLRTMAEILARSETTWENQIAHANRLADEKGLDALYSPHAATGKICECGVCFCCAALEVYNQRKSHKVKS